MNIQLKFDCSNVIWEEIYTVLKEAGMATYPPERLKKAFENSYAVIFALENSRIVGMGRAISDGAYQAALYDIAVLPAYQDKGIGRMMVHAILEKITGFNTILYASPGKERFYEKLGFKKMRTGMALFINPQAMRQRGFIA